VADQKDITLRILIEAVDKTGKALEGVRERAGKVMEALKNASAQTVPLGEGLNSVGTAAEAMAAGIEKAGKSIANAVENTTKATAEQKKATEESGAEVESFGKKVVNWMNNSGWSITRVGDLLVGLAGSIAVVMGSLAAMASEVEQVFANLRARVQMTDEEFEHSQKVITEFSMNSKYQIKDLAAALDTLVTGGMELSQAWTEMANVINLALISGTTPAQAAQAAIQTLQAFQLPMSQFSDTVDKLAYAALNSNQSLTQIASSLQKVAPLATQAGVSMEQLVAMSNLLGKSGHSLDELNLVFSRLTRQTGEQLRLMHYLGLEAARSNEGVLDFYKTIEILKEQQVDPKIIADLFGLSSRSGGAAIKIIMDNIDALKTLEGQYDKTTGAAQRAADIQSATLSAALGKTMNSIVALAETVGKNFLEPVTRAVDKITEWVQALQRWLDTMSPVQKEIATFAGSVVTIAGSIGVALVAIGLLIKAFTVLAGLAKTALAAMSGFFVLQGLTLMFEGLSTAILSARTALLAIITTSGAAAVAFSAFAAIIGGLVLMKLVELWDVVQKYLDALDRLDKQTKRAQSAQEALSATLGEFNKQTGLAVKNEQELYDAMKDGKVIKDENTGLWRQTTKAEKEAGVNALTTAKNYAALNAMIRENAVEKAKIAAMPETTGRVSLQMEQELRDLRKANTEYDALKRRAEAGDKEAEVLAREWEVSIRRKYNLQIMEMTITQKRGIRSAEIQEDKLYNDETLALYKDYYDRRLVDIETYLNVKRAVTLAEVDAEIAETKKKIKEAEATKPMEVPVLEQQLVTLVQKRRTVATQTDIESQQLREKDFDREQKILIDESKLRQKGYDDSLKDMRKAFDEQLRQQDLQDEIARNNKQLSAEERRIMEENQLKARDRMIRDYFSKEEKAFLEHEAELLKIQEDTINKQDPYAGAMDYLALKQKQYDVETELLINHLKEVTGLEEGDEAIRDARNKRQIAKGVKFTEEYLTVLSNQFAFAGKVTSTLGDAFGQLYELTGKKQKQWFYIQKALNVATAIANVATGVTEALKLGPWGMALAAAIAAAGAVQIAVIMSQQPPAMAKGGPIKGGSGSKDDVPIMAMGGEYVLQKSAVSKYGVRFIEALNRGMVEIPQEWAAIFTAKIPSISMPSYAFASGGSVSIPSAKEQQKEPITIINVIDPREMDSYLASPAGQSAVLNIMSSRAAAVKQILR